MSRRSSRPAPRLLAVLAATALLLGACRSDDGIGRRDALRGMRWTLDTVEFRYNQDVEHTEQNLAGLADWFEAEVTNPTEGMRRTMSMYLEGSTRR